MRRLDSRLTRARVAALAVGLVLLSRTAPADTESFGQPGDFLPHLSNAAAAMEYWDATAWLDSGHRLFARFLVTNQGPGVTTAAAVGHLVTPAGEVLPFKWGRRAGAWTLAESRRLEIGKATLDLRGSTIVVAVASKKRGINVEIEIDTQGVAGHTGGDYSFKVGIPGPARGRMRLQGAADAVPVTGSGAVTQTWMKRSESQLVHRRLEVMAREGGTAVYFSEIQYVDGAPESMFHVVKDGQSISTSGSGFTLAFDGATAGGDDRYPVRAQWHASGRGADARVGLARELVRFDPLTMLPQPFRLLLALGGRPQRVWAEAVIELTVDAEEDDAAVTAAAKGIAVATFASPPPPKD